jgi:ATP-dependent exoDNAse (exonuclease V) beta subunit
VTFTEAATAELRERIRANLSQAFHDIEAWRKVQAQGNLALGPLVSNILFSISCYEKCVSKPEVPE